MAEFTPNNAERVASMRQAIASDYRIKQLVQACKMANKGAIVPADSKFKHAYSIDHIVPRSQGGGDFFINLWLCPMEWNTYNGILERGPNTIKAILTWIEKNGRICYKMPISVLLAEKQDLLDFADKQNILPQHLTSWNYLRIIHTGID